MTYEEVHDICIEYGIHPALLYRDLGIPQKSFYRYVRAKAVVPDEFLPFVNKAIEFEKSCLKHSNSIRDEAVRVKLRAIYPKGSTIDDPIDKFVKRVERDIQKWKWINEECLDSGINVSIKIRVPSEDSYEVRTYEI